MVINYLYFKCMNFILSKDNSPLIIDPNAEGTFKSPDSFSSRIEGAILISIMSIQLFIILRLRLPIRCTSNGNLPVSTGGCK